MSAGNQSDGLTGTHAFLGLPYFPHFYSNVQGEGEGRGSGLYENSQAWKLPFPPLLADV